MTAAHVRVVPVGALALALLAPAVAGASSLDGGSLSVSASRPVVSPGAHYTITVSGRTPAGATHVRVSLDENYGPCPTSLGPSDYYVKTPHAGRFRYPDAFVDVTPAAGVRSWCAYASFVTAGGATVQLHASVKQTFRA